MPKRTINFYRANYNTDLIERNFQQILRGGHRHLANPNERRFVYKDNLFVKCLDYREHEHHILFHICAYEPGGPTSTIPGDDLELGANVDTQEVDPPEGRDYLNNDLFAMVRDNDVLFCSSGLHFSGFRVYIRNVILNFEDERIANTYTFTKIANRDKLEYLRANDVKKIDMRASLNQPEVVELENQTTKDKLVTFVREIFGSNRLDLNQIQNSENIQAALSLKFDTRPLENRILFEPLKSLAENILEEDDIAFDLVLANGDRINSNEITHRKRVDIEKHGNTVNKYDAWEQLQIAYAEFML